MDDLSREPPSAELDAWLRARLERPLLAVGLTIAIAGGAGATGDPPAGWLAACAPYGEIHLLWLPAGLRLDEALRRAAEQDADLLCCWLEGPLAPSDLAHADPAHGLLSRLVARAEGLGLRDRCVIALVGPAASQQRARRAGCDAGFAPNAPPARVLAALAREVAGRDAFRRGGSSPPCYL
ncbi:MAG TPA: hypothetical protein VIG30_12575 [Ktedonobacterales bacterium]|jgi:hypothetical protein